MTETPFLIEVNLNGALSHNQKQVFDTLKKNGDGGRGWGRDQSVKNNATISQM